MDQSGASAEELHRRAVGMISSGGRVPLDTVGLLAADLLTDLYIVGMARGITPEDWEAVTSLPLACLDVSRALASRHRPTPAGPVSPAQGQSAPPRPLALPAMQPLGDVERPRHGRAR
jgi:hypothetical protein